ncbi:MAG TPA: class I SAM-dependent methyltransferase [Candidatus Brocadiia bacterium]|nr:class I SAM-dependent methyltransferase [Candidatus Brocadiia bacterium]
MSVPGRLAWACVQGFLAVTRSLPGGKFLLKWADPAAISKASLRAAMERGAAYARGALLDIGCGAKPYRTIFRVSAYVGLDMPCEQRADVHGDGQMLPFRAESFDTVLCNQTLEHVPEPSHLMREALRVLRPGGALILTAPQTWGLHHEPHDYYRFTVHGLEHLARRHGFEVLWAAPTCGACAAFAQRTVDLIVHSFLRGPNSRFLASFALAPVLMLGWALDAAFNHAGDTLDNVLVARKV